MGAVVAAAAAEMRRTGRCGGGGGGGGEKKGAKEEGVVVAAEAAAERGRRLRLVGYDELPDFLRDNEFIRGYYRAEWPLRDAALSAFSWHNETLNVWTCAPPIPLPIPFNLSFSSSHRWMICFSIFMPIVCCACHAAISVGSCSSWRSRSPEPPATPPPTSRRGSSVLCY
uniref:Uncharacterized protein n=1 Tax=Oryza sativa subsp. japonica TaxID=39947 RepID=Q6ETL0_ORYSJ|nr:hypothetical protein [Oryza sativa Japonica Group]